MNKRKLETKCIDLGNVGNEGKKVPIEFFNKLSPTGSLVSTTINPSLCGVIELVCRGYTTEGYDLMFAYQAPGKRHEGILIIGRFNDGIVE